METNKRYPSDITREQFDLIREDLENAKKKTKPRKIDLYDIFNGLLYILKTGCQWRFLPKEYPKWRTVHEYFLIWRKSANNKKSLLEKVLKKIGWKGESETGSEIQNEIHYRRRTECEEY